MAFRGRSITLNSVIWPASFQRMMSTPLTSTPSIFERAEGGDGKVEVHTLCEVSGRRGRMGGRHSNIAVYRRCISCGVTFSISCPTSQV